MARRPYFSRQFFDILQIRPGHYELITYDQRNRAEIRVTAGSREVIFQYLEAMDHELDDLMDELFSGRHNERRERL